MDFNIKVMKFLHIFDTGGFGALLGTKDKHNTHDVLQLKQFDPFGFAEYYKGTTTFFDDAVGVISKMKEIYNDYDHIIFNDLPQSIDQVEDHPSLSVIYHGSSLRESPDRKEDLTAHRVFVSDEDLIPLRPDAKYLKCPIDRELFSTRKCGTGTVLHLRDYHKKTYQDSEYPDMLIDVNVIFKGKPFCKYVDMPNELAKYNTYLDVRWNYKHPPKLIECISATALQMLSIGGNVMDNDYNLITSFDDKFDIKNMLKEFLIEFG